MDTTLEVIVLPVSDVDRAKEFYRDKVGFRVDLDGEVMEGVRDAKAAYDELSARGLDVSEPVQFAPQDGATFMYVKDPDGWGSPRSNEAESGGGWEIQEYRKRGAEPLHHVLAQLAASQQ
ncbi:VOC family protein [Streptomyces sp. NPDC088350]|uniref:VOC family protein n=1 Tax=Streptomyces sp. NPDC088350 TaxID=3365854 RepID=UPI00381DF840